MRNFILGMCVGVAMLLISNSAHAALWSSSNAVAAPGRATLMRVHFTGDGRTTDAHVDIAVSSGFTVTVTPRNGALCAVRPGSTSVLLVVRVLTSSSSSPLASAQTTLCDIPLVANTFASSGRFIMFHDEYAFPVAVGPPDSRCELDSGYVTVVR